MIVFVDVDDTLIRTIGSKRVPVPRVIESVRELSRKGAVLYCWSTGGAEYARRSAEEVGLLDAFQGFLPKPQILIDDQPVQEWRDLKTLHPIQVESWLKGLTA